MDAKFPRRQSQSQQLPLLVTRQRAAAMLGRSVASIMRLEGRGLLTKIKLGSERSQTMLKVEEVLRLAQGRRGD